MPDALTALKAAQSGDSDAEQAFVAENLPLVHSVCKRFLHRGVEYEDLVQLGSIGLIKAIRRFDASFNVCFSTYAVPLIAGEIKRFLRDDGMIKFSRGAKTLAYRIDKLCEENGNMSVEELAAALKVSKEEVAIAIASRNSALSLDGAATDEGATLLDFFGSSSFEEEAQDRLFIEQLLSSLQPRERLIVQLRFFQNKTQTQVAERLNISQVQVSRLERKILLSLRKQASG
ncbi:MAG: sigma-70 family RNA polymerase sigma factor [Clostridia bacterium]|nr:sigma-70 family RNA polymerase sigma factor [Clostridia bacterium]